MVLHAAVVLGALLVGLPVHAGGALVEDLHAVHAAVALAGVGIAREDHRQRDEAAAILRPALQDGVIEEREAVVRMTSWQGPLATIFGKERAHFGQLRQHFELADQALGHAHFEKLDDARGDLVDGHDFERDLHAAHGGEGIDEHGNVEALGLFEEQRGAAALHGAVGEFGDFEDGIHFEGDALQFLVLFECADELAQVAIGHYFMSMALSAPCIGSASRHQLYWI